MDKLLKVLIKEPEKEFHVRKLSRILKKSPSTISKYIELLLNRDLITKRKLSNLLLVQLNQESDLLSVKKAQYEIELDEKADNLIRVHLKEPEKEFHVRELSRILKKSPSTISKYSEILVNQGVLTKRRLSNLILFKLNQENKFVNLKKAQFLIEDTKKLQKTKIYEKK